MKIDKTKLDDVLVIQPKIFEDNRGYFYESFKKSIFEEAVGKTVNFVQDNQSKSSQGTLRGLHYQLLPKAQGKLVRVLNGEIFDVAVDIRSTSKNFGKWFGIILSESNKKQLWIPEGFAHGFLTMSETAEIAYKTTNYYAPNLERSIIWSDPEINIKWPKTYNSILSSKDAQALFLNEAEVF
jgi:dTDP-4-dehydrorhamnose 3,5-epimerase